MFGRISTIGLANTLQGQMTLYAPDNRADTMKQLLPQSDSTSDEQYRKLSFAIVELA